MIEVKEMEIILECAFRKGLINTEARDYITDKINDYINKKQMRDFEIANSYKRPYFK